MFSRLELNFSLSMNRILLRRAAWIQKVRRRSRNFYIFFAAHRSAWRRQRASYVVELQRRSSRTALKDFSASIYYVMSCLRTRPPQHGRENQPRKRWQAVIASKIESSERTSACGVDHRPINRRTYVSNSFIWPFAKLPYIIFMYSRTYILKCPFLLGATTSPVDEWIFLETGRTIFCLIHFRIRRRLTQVAFLGAALDFTQLCNIN